ncbi:MAG: hypothetical protein ACXVB9_07335 [Bdellovibrionota bacterium]
MSDTKRRAANALPLKQGPAHSSTARSPQSNAPKSLEPLRQVKLEAERLREKLQKSVIDNPQTAKKAALLISMWIEGKERKRKKAG